MIPDPTRAPDDGPDHAPEDGPQLADRIARTLADLLDQWVIVLTGVVHVPAEPCAFCPPPERPNTGLVALDWRNVRTDRFLRRYCCAGCIHTALHHLTGEADQVHVWFPSRAPGVPLLPDPPLPYSPTGHRAAPREPRTPLSVVEQTEPAPAVAR